MSEQATTRPANLAEPRRPEGCPVVHPHEFPPIPPAPFGLTEDLFSALDFLPLFNKHVGHPIETEASASTSEIKPAKREGSASAGPSTPVQSGFGDVQKPVKKTITRKWMKPQLYYEALLPELPDPRPLREPLPQLIPLISDTAPAPTQPDPPGFRRQDIHSATFRFDPVIDPTNNDSRIHVSLPVGRVTGMKDLYENGKKNPRRNKVRPHDSPSSDKNRRKKNAEKHRKEAAARNRMTAPGLLEHSNTANTPGTPRSAQPRTPGYASPSYRPSTGGGSRAGTPAYAKSVGSPRVG